MEKITQKLLLNIDQVARLTGVPKSTLRYREKCFPEFLKPDAPHPCGGNTAWRI